MQITFEALERALAPIEEIGKGEVTFEVGPTTVSLRVLLPEEEAEVQKYASQVTDLDAEESSGQAMLYLERFKLALMSYALVAIGDQDLRGVEFIDTDEKLPNGVAVKLPKVQALRKLLGRWSSPVRLTIFRKYTEMLTKVEKKAEASIKFEPADVDAEIERLTTRVEQLKAIKEQELKTAETEVSKVAKAIVADVPPVAASTPVQAPEPAPPAPAVRQSAIPTAAQPQARVVQPTASIRPAPAPPVVAQASQEDHYVADMDVPDSFINPGDDESMADAIAAENYRLLQHRRAAQTGVAQQEGPPSVLSAIHQRRPPHMDAVEVTESAESMYIGRTADGVETFRMTPPEELAGHSATQVPKVKVASSANPRFQPPRKP